MSRLLNFLSKGSGLGESDVYGIIQRAPVSYKVYSIPKRRGGTREIAQPAREVKALQRLFVHGLGRLPIHEAATAYRDGSSIKLNASAHAKSNPILKFDFENFFPSIKSKDWENYCKDNFLFDSFDISLSSKLLFRKAPGSTILRLAIGAPSSPWLSNVLMFQFDNLISNLVAKDKVIYTRYADDVTFSAPRTGHLTGVEKNMRTALSQISYPTLKINETKTVLATKKYRRVVTGLVLSLDGKVTVGRDRKRLVRSMIEHLSNSKEISVEFHQFKGLLAFCLDVEPDYFSKIILDKKDSLPDEIVDMVKN